MTKFENRFLRKLNENADEQEAFNLELDDDTSPEDFDVDMDANVSAESDTGDASVAAARATAQMHAEQIELLNSWVTQGNEYLSLLNDAKNPNSIQTVLSKAADETLFARMKQSEQRKITRVATELAALNESFKGYLAQSDNAQFRGV